MKLDFKDFEIRDQRAESRTMVAVSKDLFPIIGRMQLPSERKWETVQRLLIAGINAERSKTA